MPQYSLAEPGVDPIANPIPRSKTRSQLLLWLVVGVAFIGIIVLIITRTASARAASVATPTLARRVIMASATIMPTEPMFTATAARSQTPWIITRVVDGTPIVIRQEVTRIVPYAVTQVVVQTVVKKITTTPGPTQTPWIIVITATATEDPTNTPTITPTYTETPTPDYSPTAVESPTPEITP